MVEINTAVTGLHASIANDDVDPDVVAAAVNAAEEAKTACTDQFSYANQILGGKGGKGPRTATP